MIQGIVCTVQIAHRWLCLLFIWMWHNCIWPCHMFIRHYVHHDGLLAGWASWPIGASSQIIAGATDSEKCGRKSKQIRTEWLKKMKSGHSDLHTQNQLYLHWCTRQKWPQKDSITMWYHKHLQSFRWTLSLPVDICSFHYARHSERRGKVCATIGTCYSELHWYGFLW